MSRTTNAIIGEPEVLEYDVATNPAWLDLKAAAAELRVVQVARRQHPRRSAHAAAEANVERIRAAIVALSDLFPHDARTSPRSTRDFARWADERIRRARLSRLAERVPAAAAPGRRPAAPRGLPDVHAERQHATGSSKPCSSR